jgi:protein tyrosine phosphatase (PTP) superfamily phosphohydrolase (DUF442 family)
MMTWLRGLLGCLLLGLLIGGPIAYSKHRQAQFRNFRVVDEGKLYRSGQLSLEGVKRVIQERGVKTVVSLRYSDDPSVKPPDWREEEYCHQIGVRYVRLRPDVYHALEEGGEIPADKPIREFTNLLDDPAVYPVLIHCFAGKHRTGAFCAIYRMEYQGWTNEEAIHDLRAMGYETLDQDRDVQDYLHRYVPRAKRAKAPLVEAPDDGRMKR